MGESFPHQRSCVAAPCLLFSVRGNNRSFVADPRCLRLFASFQAALQLVPAFRAGLLNLVLAHKNNQKGQSETPKAASKRMKNRGW